MGFGIIVQGGTYHDQHLARESARAMMDIQTQYTMPFAYEILHVKSIDQVPDRVSGSHNKGIRGGKSAKREFQKCIAILYRCECEI